jgi:hypothetical protein
MILLVCGPRDFTDSKLLFDVLNGIHNTDGIEEIVCGGAKGADLLAARWAWNNSVDLKVVFAKWKEHGKRAGPMRNITMAEYLQGKVGVYEVGVLAVARGTPGTTGMINQAQNRGIDVRIVPETEQGEGG